MGALSDLFPHCPARDVPFRFDNGKVRVARERRRFRETIRVFRSTNWAGISTRKYLI